MWTDDSLREFGWTIQKLIEKKDLGRRESREMFRQVLENRQPELQQGAFLAALTAKGETPREIAGAWEAIVELDTNTVAEEFEAPLVENSGTGMGHLKPFNVSTAAAGVAAAGGVRLARHGARALTSTCGTVDLLEEIGIDVECDVDTVSRSIKTTGIGLFNGMSPHVHPRSLARILSRIRFGSTLNIAASLASPCRPTHALRGVYSRDLIPKASEVMKEIGYRRAMVVHGLDAEGQKGMDELSNIGESVVREFFPDGREETYTLAPEEVGMKRAAYKEIAASGDRKKEALRFLKVLGGRDFPECVDITCLNAGAIFYLVGKAGDIRAGVETSREMIHGGGALKKLSHWVSVQTDHGKDGIRRYMNLAGKAGVEKEALRPLQ